MLLVSKKKDSMMRNKVKQIYLILGFSDSLIVMYIMLESLIVRCDVEVNLFDSKIILFQISSQKCISSDNTLGKGALKGNVTLMVSWATRPSPLCVHVTTQRALRAWCHDEILALTSYCSPYCKEVLHSTSAPYL